MKEQLNHVPSSADVDIWTWICLLGLLLLSVGIGIGGLAITGMNQQAAASPNAPTTAPAGQAAAAPH